MDLRGLGLGNISPAAVILGAGASRGASFAAENVGGALPPLDADFFAQLERLPRRSTSQKNLLTFLAREFGTDFRSMESVFSQLVASDEISSLPQRRRGPHLQAYSRAADQFLESLTELLQDTCADRECRFHETLARRLRAGDTVISFNYDCLVDSSLANYATAYGRWDALRGYGFPVTVGGQYWGSRVDLPHQANPIRLLKPHGSLNWQVSSAAGGPTTLSLRQNPYEGSARGRIIPPIAQKEIAEESYRSVWAAARDALSEARALLVVGYSAADVDPVSQALIRLHTATSRPALRSLIVADLSAEVRARFRVLCRSAIQPGHTTIHEFESFGELAGVL